MHERFVQCKDSKDCGQVMLTHYLAFRQSVVQTSWPAVGTKIGLYNKKRAEEIKIIIDGGILLVYVCMYVCMYVCVNCAYMTFSFCMCLLH